MTLTEDSKYLESHMTTKQVRLIDLSSVLLGWHAIHHEMTRSCSIFCCSKTALKHIRDCITCNRKVPINSFVTPATTPQKTLTQVNLASCCTTTPTLWKQWAEHHHTYLRVRWVVVLPRLLCESSEQCITTPICEFGGWFHPYGKLYRALNNKMATTNFPPKKFISHP